MKIKILIVILIAFSATTYAQTSGMRVLKDRFKGEENVETFKLGGLLARAAFSLAGDYEYKEAVSNIRSIEFITIPKDVFDAQHVSVKGYKKFLEENDFSNLMEVKDGGDHVTIYLAPGAERHERYLIIADEGSEVTVIELKGHIDPSKLSSTKITSSEL